MVLLAVAPGPLARPYASQIAWAAPDHDFQWGSTAIRYYLSGSADAVIIRVLSGDDGTVAASFAGPTGLGPQTVLWNGTVDNASGTPVPLGDYRLAIQAEASSPSAWSIVRTNTPVGGGGDLETLPDYFPSSGIAIDDEPESPSFGLTHISLSEGDASGTHGVLSLEPDLSLVRGGALALAGLPWTGAGSSVLAPWGLDAAPDGEIWAAGQTPGEIGVRLARGLPNGLGERDVGGSEPLVVSPRDVLLTGRGAQRVLRWTQETLSSGAVVRATIGDGDTLASPGVAVAVEIDGSAGAGFYGRSLAADDGGNLYLLARVSQSGGVTHVFRFDASALAAGPLPLSTAQAVWDVQITDRPLLTGSGLAIAHGDPADPLDDVIYALLPQSSSFGTEAGIYRVGASATPSLAATLTETDRVVDLSAEDLSGDRTDIACDWAGNIVLADPYSEYVLLISPPGPSSALTPGPSSQVLRVIEAGPPGPSGLVLH